MDYSGDKKELLDSHSVQEFLANCKRQGVTTAIDLGNQTISYSWNELFEKAGAGAGACFAANYSEGWNLINLDKIR